MKTTEYKEIQEQDNNDLDFELGMQMSSLGPIPKSKQQAAEVIKRIFNSSDQPFYTPGNDIQLGTDLKKIKDKIRFFEYGKSFQAEKEGRGFNFEGMLAGLFNGKPIVSKAKEDILVGKAGVPYSVKTAEPGSSFDSGTLIYGFKNELQDMEANGIDTTDIKTPYDLLKKEGEEYVRFKIAMLTSMFTSSDGKPLNWIFSLIYPNYIEYTTWTTDDLINEMVMNPQMIGVGRSPRTDVRLKSRFLMQNPNIIQFPSFTADELKKLRYVEDRGLKTDKIAELFGKYKSKVRYDVLQYIRKNPQTFLKRVINLYGDKLGPMLKEKGFVELNESINYDDVNVQNAIIDILQEGTCGDQEWHTGDQGEFFTLDGSENLGVTDMFVDDGFDIVHKHGKVHLSDLSPDETETTIPHGSKSPQKTELKPNLNVGPFNISVNEGTEKGHYGYVFSDKIPLEVDNKLYVLVNKLGGITHEDITNFIENTNKETLYILQGLLRHFPSTLEELLYYYGSLDSLRNSDEYKRIVSLVKRVGSGERITEDTDIFGQGLLDPIEPEEFEGDEEEWEKLMSDVENDPESEEPEYEYTGGKTDPAKGFVAPSAEVTDNICKVKGFCEAQGPITFGQLRELVEEAQTKRIQADMGRGLFKTMWRIIPFFIPQILLAAVGVTVTRAINKIVTPALKDTRGYKNFWGKIVLKAMDVAEGDYVPDIALGDDPLGKVFFISDGLLQMIRDKYKLKFARYVADYAATRPDNEPVPDWFVENLLRDYLNQKFMINPPLEPKEGTDFNIIKEHEDEEDPQNGIQTREPFTRTEAQILNYLSKEFTWEELNTISSVDETQVMSDLGRKWDGILKLFGQAPSGDEEAWIRSTRWAKWAVENWSEACGEGNTGDGLISCDFKDVTNPIKSWPAWFEVDADESYWQKEFRSGTIEIGAYDSEDAEERADESWWEYDPDMEHYDYGDTDDHDIEMRDVRYIRALNEHKESKINPDLDKGDIIRVIEIDGEHANMPDVWGIYKVHDVRQDNATQEFYYQLSGETSEVIHDRLMNGKYLYYGDTWIPADIPMATNVDRKTISEHKESKKLNPELMVGDEILVVSTEGIRDFGAPELYKPYVVVGIKHGTTMMKGGKELEDYSYYQVEPIGMTDEERTGAMLAGGGRMKPMYIFPSANRYGGGDQWILRPGFLRGEGLNEHVPKPGSSSAEGIKDDSLPYETDYLNLDEILSSIKSIPYYNEVIIDLKDDNDDWAVTQTVKRYADYWMKNPETLTSDDFPPIQVIGDGLKDGAHRISTLNALAKHIDPDNPYWKEVKLEVRFYQPEIVKDIGPTWVNGELVYNTDEGLQSKSAQELEEFCPMGNPNKCTPVDYDKLPDMLHEHKGVRNMQGFTPKLIGYLKFMFETKTINYVEQFQTEARQFMGIDSAFATTLYLILLYNKESRHNSIVDLLNDIPVENYEIPKIYEYEITYHGAEERFMEQEECDDVEGIGEYSGEDCDCSHAVKAIEDEEGYTEEKECDYDSGDEDCECLDWEHKEYEVYSNPICTKVVLSLDKLEKTDSDRSYTYGYDELYEIENELGNDWVEEYSECDDNYDDAAAWDYFNDKEDQIIGLDTNVWEPKTWNNYFTEINNKIYGVKPLIDIIEDQYDVMSQRDKKMTELTSQIYNVLDNSFDLFEHPEGEIEYEGNNMALYSHDMKDFVPFDYIYNPIEQMLDGGIQQEDIEIFVEIITNWITKNLSTPEEHLNEEVNIKSDNSNYSQEDYDNFVDFAHKELNIDDDCPIDVETEPSSEYTTGNYHINDRKIKILDNGRKLADILRTIAHELVHHKQNELGMLVGDIPEIGGKIEDQANAYAGRLVKKYGKQTPNLYSESKKDILSEEKVVGFNNPNNNFVVIAGGPGAGKSFITRNLINLDNVKEFNVDQVRVMTAKKLWGDEWEEKISTEEGYDEILKRTFTTSDPRNLTVKFLKEFLQTERNQPVNVVYDAGGGQEQVMKDIHTLAKDNGFTTTLVYVRTPLDIAQERNIERPRSLPPEMVAQYHQQVKDNMRHMIPIFDNVWTVDNKEMIDLSNRPSDNIEKIK